MGDHEIPDTDPLRDELRSAWQRYVDLLAPLRPDLHRYCRRLTGSLWDAEDLAQDTLLRAFAILGNVHHRVANPRAYLLRVASHTWIDTIRRRSSEAAALAAGLPGAAGPEAARGEVRDAGAMLMQRLAPQERAAIVLKDVFDLSLEEIAAVLATTTGAVKSALHRGRARLREPEAGPAAARPAPSLALVDRFVAAWRASDLPALLALVVEDATVENVGCGVELGREAGGQGFLYKAVHGHPEWPAAFQPEAVRLDRGVVEGVPLVLCFATRQGREALEQALRFDEADGRIARLRGYAFCPETMREVGSALGLPVRTGLYRFPTPAPGAYWESAAPAPEGGTPAGASSRAS
jgi:RNA polymerase sigma-70 factor (ECF subfamily)